MRRDSARDISLPTILICECWRIFFFFFRPWHYFYTFACAIWLRLPKGRSSRVVFEKRPFVAFVSRRISFAWFQHPVQFFFRTAVVLLRVHVCLHIAISRRACPLLLSQALRLSSAPRRISLPLMTPCHCDSHNAHRNVASRGLRRSVLARMALMWSAINGDLFSASVGYRSCSVLLALPLRRTQRLASASLPGARSLLPL